MQIEEFISLLVVGPLTAYFLIIGLIHARGRILVVSGRRDFGVLALALMGLVAAGPVELFFPSMAMVGMGVWVWGALAFLYALTVLLIMLNMRPQFVVYGASHSLAAMALLAAAKRQDSGAVLLTEFVDLPQSGLRLQIASNGYSACRITAISSTVYLRQWYTLRKDLQAEFDRESSTSRMTGFFFLGCASLMVAIMAFNIASNPQAIAKAFENWLHH